MLYWARKRTHSVLLSW